MQNSKTCARLRATRWPVDGWEAGADTTEVHRLAEYWATSYDWRTHEARINALPLELKRRARRSGLR